MNGEKQGLPLVKKGTMVTIYGLKNCDSTRKIIQWCKQHKVNFMLHDFKQDGIDKKLVQQWLMQTDETILLNKQSTTWEHLTQSEQAAANETATLIELFVQYPTLLKRPIIVKNHQLITVGAKPASIAILENLFQ